MPAIALDEALTLVKSADLPPALATLARQGAFRRYRKGTLLIEEGDPGDTLFVIIEGRLKVFTVGPTGRELTFGVYGSGEYVGEMSLDGGLRSASVITVDTAVCSVIARPIVRAYIETHPSFAFDVINRVIHRARLATDNVRKIALNDVYTRVTELLSDLAVSDGDGGRLIEFRITHADIASRAGCSREMVSRLLKDLADGGYVKTSGRRLRILKDLPNRW